MKDKATAPVAAAAAVAAAAGVVAATTAVVAAAPATAAVVSDSDSEKLYTMYKREIMEIITCSINYIVYLQRHNVTYR